MEPQLPHRSRLSAIAIRQPQWLLRWTCAVVLLLLGAAIADSPAPRQAIPPKGIVILWGGGEATQSLAEKFASHKASEKSSSEGMIWVGSDKSLESTFAKKHAAFAIVSPTDSSLIAKISAAEMAWVNLPEVASDTSVLDRVLIDPHFLDQSPPAALLAKLTAEPGLIGVGVSPSTALVFNGRAMEVAGSGEVAICLPASVTRPNDRPVKIERLRQGGKADLLALSRAAIARLGPQYPPDTMPVPNVPNGTVMPCGGGTLPDPVYKRFIELAGGLDAPIVVMPIAQPDPDNSNPSCIDALKRLGCRDLVVLRQHTHEQVESPAFIAAVSRAKGIFFAGGRQWKYIDAYEGTSAPKLFNDVLTRGGVIAGSSAGAAVQADYMCRGDPLGNTDVSAEGYERGLCFLPGMAIDIHVTQRNRLAETKSLIHQFPQLLGLALDEQTAGEVHGHIMTISGNGKAAILDGHTGSTLELKAGDRYDLQARQLVK